MLLVALTAAVLCVPTRHSDGLLGWYRSRIPFDESAEVVVCLAPDGRVLVAFNLAEMFGDERLPIPDRYFLGTWIRGSDGTVELRYDAPAAPTWEHWWRESEDVQDAGAIAMRLNKDVTRRLRRTSQPVDLRRSEVGAQWWGAVP
jgi:hypothetical protein